MPSALQPRHGHRLARKAHELAVVIQEAAGLSVRASADPPRLAPGGRGAVSVVAAAATSATELSVTRDRAARGSRSALRPWMTAHGFPVAAAPRWLSQIPIRRAFDPLAANGELAVTVSATIGGRKVERAIDLEEAFRVLPASSLSLEPDAVIVNLARPVAADRRRGPCRRRRGAGCLHAARRVDGGGIAGGFSLTPPADLAPGRFTIAATVAANPASRVRSATLPHLGTTEWAEPCRASRSRGACCPAGGRPRRLCRRRQRSRRFWLRRLGVDGDVARCGDAGRRRPVAFTTIVVGIFAFGTRPDLAAARPRLQAWVEAGGHLVTLYHRPSDGWNPDETPPRHLEIGLPSLRWRVTDPKAPVKVLLPDHPLLTGPNRIGPADWEGWDKERGLYFASKLGRRLSAAARHQRYGRGTAARVRWYRR